MLSWRRISLLLRCAVVAVGWVNAAPGGFAEAVGPPAWGDRAVRFERIAEGRFVVQGGARALLLSPDGLTFLDKESLSLRFHGANPTAPQGLDQLVTRTNYLLGDDRRSWRVGVPNYGSVAYRGLYDGIDLVVRSAAENIEYDFHVAPGADPASIELRVEGAGETRIEANGDLTLSRRGFRLLQRRPLAYQTANGARRLVEAAFERRGEHAIGFRLGAYDATQPLLIDPLVYASFLGPFLPQAMVVDAQGAAYIVGQTRSSAFPATEGSLQPEFSEGVCLALGILPGSPTYAFPCDDIVVAKMNPAGTALEYATYLGGKGLDYGVDIAVDAAGNAYVLAGTGGGLPTTAGVVQPKPADTAPAYLAKLDPSGQSLVFATYLGGGARAYPTALAIDAAENIYVTGAVLSPAFPTTPGAFQRDWNRRGQNPEGDAFVTKLNPGATALLYSTFLGGSSSETPYDIQVDSEGQAYVAGLTNSPDFPTTAGVLQASYPEAAQQAGFVTKLAANGDALIYSTFLRDTAYGISLALDAAGHAYVAGAIVTGEFPFTAGALRRGSGGFLAKLAADAAEFVYAAEVGGWNHALAIDAGGNAYLAGSAASEFGDDFEPTPGAVQPCGGINSGFAAKVSPDGRELLYGTFVDLSSETLRAIDVGPDGSIYIAGAADLRGFPLTPEAFLPEPIAGETNGFVAKIDPAAGSRFLPSQVRHSASYEQGGVAPGEWITLFNPGIGPDTPAMASIRPEQRGVTELGGVRVLFDGTPGYLTYAHRCQINAVVPFAVAGRESVEIRVEYADATMDARVDALTGASADVATGALTGAGASATTDAVTVAVVEAAPGLYSNNGFGGGNAAALNEDLTVNGPDQPARRGSFVALFGSGAGLMDPPLEDGLPAAAPFPAVGLPVAILYMDPATREFREAVVTYAGAAPELLAGMLQVNFQVPPDIQIPEDRFHSGLYALPVRLRIGGRESLTLSVWIGE